MPGDILLLETEWQQVPENLLSILADLNNAVVWNGFGPSSDF